MENKIIMVLQLACVALSLVGAENMTFKRLTTQDGLSDNHVIDMIQLSDRRLIVSTWGSVNIHDGSRFDYVPLTSTGVFPVPNGMMNFYMGIDMEDRIWVKRTTELWCFDLRRGTYVEDFDSLFHRLCPTKEAYEKPTKVFVDRQRQLWVITEHCIYNVAKSGQALLLPADFGEVCAVEAEGDSVWAFNSIGRCILYDGKNDNIVKDGADITRQGDKLPLNEGMPRVASKDFPPVVDRQNSPYWSLIIQRGADGIFYQLFGGHQSKLFTFDPRSGIQRELATLGCFARSMDLSPDGNLWIGTRHGIHVFTPEGDEREYIDSFSLGNGREMETRDVTFVFFDDHNDLWLGMTGYGLLFHHNCPYRMVSGKTTADVDVPDSLSMVFRMRRAKQYRTNQGINDNLTDSRGWRWETSVRGVRLVRSGEAPVRVLTRADGLSSNFTQSIVEDKRGNIWVSSSKGISRIEMTSDGGFDITNFDESDGTLSEEYVARSAACLPDGRIAMEGSNGWTVFHPNRVMKHSQPLTPLLTGITMPDGGDILRDAVAAPFQGKHKLELAYDQNQLIFDFSACYHAHPHQTHYRWRLIGGNDEGTWHAANHIATPALVGANGGLHLPMMQLSPGDYRLEVEASTNGEHYIGERTTFTFCILPPWWKTWWAYTLYVMGALLIVVLVAYAYIRRQKREFEWRRQEEVLQLRIRHLLESVAPVANFERQAVNDEQQLVTGEEYGGDGEQENQRHLIDKKASANISDEEIQLTEQDQQFIQKVVVNIEKNLCRAYTVEQLAADMCMERTGLYKRLTALIDQSPQSFIRSVRLQRAADLLSRTNDSINDIAYAVGFTSPSHLVKCFREKYGCTPGEWRNRG